MGLFVPLDVYYLVYRWESHNSNATILVSQEYKTIWRNHRIFLMHTTVHKGAPFLPLVHCGMQMCQKDSARRPSLFLNSFFITKALGHYGENMDLDEVKD